MTTLTTGKVAEVMFEKALETHEHQMQMLTTVDFHTPDGATLQNAGDVVWTPVQQYAPVIEGWDLTGQETGIIEETYPSQLGTPKNDFVEQRADKMRTMRFWERRAEESGRTQASNLNKTIAQAIAIQGSLFYRSNVTSGYEFIAEGQAILNERQVSSSERYFFLNDRDNLKFGKDLAARQTLQGRPETTWETGQIGQNVAGFDLYTASFLPNLAGGVSPDTTVTAAQSFEPEAGTVNTVTGVVENKDYRIAEIPVLASGGYNIGDKVFFINTDLEPLKSLGLADKTPTNVPMSFTIVGKPNATSIQVYPKPIALDDAALSTLQKAYANVDTTIGLNAVVQRENIDVSNKVNLFWDKKAIEVMGGNIPANLFKSYDGMKVITDTMKNGLQFYMVYDGSLETMTFRYRLFTWYGITVCAPFLCGVALTY
jgi:hypothetical protein